MKDYIIILLILLELAHESLLKKAHLLNLFKREWNTPKKENYDLAIFYLKLNIKENNIPDSIRVKRVFLFTTCLLFVRTF